MFKKYCEASIRQIAKNCGKDSDYVIETIMGLQEDLEDKSIVYDAMSGDFVSMEKSGIIDPYQVLQMSIENSVSAACNILSVNYFIIDKDKDKVCQHK